MVNQKDFLSLWYLGNSFIQNLGDFLVKQRSQIKHEQESLKQIIFLLQKCKHPHGYKEKWHQNHTPDYRKLYNQLGNMLKLKLSLGSQSNPSKNQLTTTSPIRWETPSKAPWAKNNQVRANLFI